MIDCESGAETLVGNDIDIDDVIWTGPVPSVADMAAESGISHTAPMGALQSVFEQAKAQGRKGAFSPSLSPRLDDSTHGSHWTPSQPTTRCS